MKRFSVIADAGSVRIHHGSLTCDFRNGYGDGRIAVIVTERRDEYKFEGEGWQFVDSFQVNGPGVCLASADWMRDCLHEFQPGLYFVNVQRHGRLVVIEFARPLLEEEK